MFSSNSGNDNIIYCADDDSSAVLARAVIAAAEKWGLHAVAMVGSNQKSERPLRSFDLEEVNEGLRRGGAGLPS